MTASTHQLILQEQIYSAYKQVASLVDAAIDKLSSAGVGVGNKDSCKLALTEAINNVIEHAYDESIKEIIDLKILLSDEEIVFHLTDSGKPVDPAMFEGRRFSLPEDDMATGGWGLYLIHELMDDIRYYSLDGENHLVIIKWRDINE